MTDEKQPEDPIKVAREHAELSKQLYQDHASGMLAIQPDTPDHDAALLLLSQLAENAGAAHQEFHAVTQRNTWTEWSLPAAPHVIGRWTSRVFDHEAQMFEEQTVQIECRHPGCGAKWQTKCASGRVRDHVASFGMNHLHRDPLFTPKHKAGGA